jgi:hypothetical protein
VSADKNKTTCKGRVRCGAKVSFCAASAGAYVLSDRSGGKPAVCGLA